MCRLMKEHGLIKLMIMTQEITIQYIFKFLIIWFIHNVQTDERTWFNETLIMTQEITIKYIYLSF